MPEHNRFSTWSDLLLTALTPLIWGSTYLVTTEFLPPGRPFTAALVRVLPAGLLLVAVAGCRIPRAFWGRLLILSLLNIGLFQALLFIAAYRLPGGLAAVIGATQPLVVMALGWWLDARRPPRVAVLGALAGVAGMAVLLLSPRSALDPVGMLAAAGGALSMACGTFLGRRWHAGLPVAAMTGWQLLLGGLVLWPVAALYDPPLPRLTTQAMLGYAYLCLFGALLAYWLWFRGLRRLSAASVSTLGLLSPLSAAVLGWTVLGQTLSWSGLAGFLTVLFSVLVVQRGLLARPA